MKMEFLTTNYSDVERKQVACFFWGKLPQPYLTARCLIALENVVQSSFAFSVTLNCYRNYMI
ncbi:MAG: hypothetical protein IKX24_07450 [Prevotella sp.]|nr:hypothetical protein [Prevotella sp.]